MAEVEAHGMCGRDVAVLEQQVRNTWSEEPQVCEFLVRSFAQALHGRRKGDMCVPFPTVFGKGDRRDFQAAESCLENLPFDGSRLDEMRPLSEEQVLLLHWILFSHKNNAKRLKATTMSHLQESSPLLVEEIQQEGKNLCPDTILETQNNDTVDWNSGTDLFPAFHGTHPENIHSIVRVGLLNLSSTHMQRTGRAFGEGIYLARELATAFSFTRSPCPSNWINKHEGMRCVFVCSVTNAETLTSQLDVPKNYVVVRECDRVIIRYVLIYREHRRSNKRIDFCALLVFIYLATLLCPVILEQIRWHGTVH